MAMTELPPRYSSAADNRVPITPIPRHIVGSGDIDPPAPFIKRFRRVAWQQTTKAAIDDGRDMTGRAAERP
jgi:hypothetical protein